MKILFILFLFINIFVFSSCASYDQSDRVWLMNELYFKTDPFFAETPFSK